ncbi:Glycine betaine transporter OpuD [Lachnospiraceae bacterium TWA4]|nr:Glycine betaine transporter OpuD [Lachnospiraceae bacterium TWA4]
MNEGKKDNHVLIVSAIIVVAFVLFGAIFPSALEKGANALLSGITSNFGWMYLLTVFLMILFMLFIALGPMGKLKLGKPEDEPEFSNFQWFTMLFGGAMGIGLVFYSVAEPLMHYSAPPTAEPQTAAAMHEAMETVFFHWGFHPWVIYAIGGLALGYFSFKKDRPFLVSSSFEPLIGEKRVKGPIGKAIDILAVFATIFGVATSLGLGAVQICTGLNYIYGVKTGTAFTCIVIAIITVAFTIATITGLQKGVQLIADVKIWMSIGFMIFIFVFGGAVMILDLFTNTFGGYLGGLIEKSLWVGMENKDFMSGWTIFYWAWWIAWAPFCGQFCARVSKGRTVRQYLLTVSLMPAFLSFIWLSIYGGAAFNLDSATNGAISAAVNADSATGLFALLNQMPLYMITAPLAILLIVFSFLGSANSATFVLAMLTDHGNMDPSKKLRAGWGIAQGVVTIVCFVVGGTSILKILQATSIVAAFPYMIVMILMCVSIFKTLSKDAKDEGLKK